MKSLSQRKLTKNEKLLLSALGSIIIILLAFKLIIDPQKTKLLDLNEKKIQYEEEIAKINEVLRKEDSIDKEWKKLDIEKKSILGKYFGSLNQPEIIYLLNDLLQEENVHILDMSFGHPSEEIFEDLSVEVMDITIPYKGNYEGITKMVKNLESSPKKILTSNLIMDRNIDNELSGNMSLKLYSLEGIAEVEDTIAYIDTNIIDGKPNPFVAFEDFEKEKDLADNEIHNSAIVGDSMTAPSIEQETKSEAQRDILESFHRDNIYFIPSHKNISGRVSKSSNSKDGNHSLRLEYNILATEDENRAYIDLSDRNIILKYPPNSIGLWVYSYSYSPTTIGLGFKGQAMEKVDVEFSKGINWIGWNYLELGPPQDLSLYPLQLDKIYLELNYNREDYGVILFDKLEADYPKNDSADVNRFTFYIVEKGDDLNKISLINYGTISKKNLIMKYNEIKSDSDLKEGRILVIPK